MKPVVARLLWLCGYVLLIGPPRLYELKHKARQTGNELSNLPFTVLIGVEVLVRLGLFLMIVTATEALTGKARYDYFLLDFFFAALALAGAGHLAVFLLCFSVCQGNPSSMRWYRLGRNTIYAVPPALVAGLLALLWQHQNHQALVSGNLVQQAFGLCWAGFFMLGLAEAWLMRRKPTGLDTVLSASIRNR
ncbi:hypothetical protein [Alteromonas lipolytica]|uniref:Uncharacterized protein n=1 Tax=Alteromonas lipolytica TaxID=1856405 RepID=A0A1E8FBS8_9ALTE|nr:hypothetical protein [Alteromonas lipolytica]OFI33058.1 hypothetical protein BFC17_01960 [Alteromonas lipolytica]GGF62900.1 hypothetical protein GCM10011338_14150 [Alteromonas lipolytica]